MPVKIPNNLPAIELLKEENIFVMSQLKANQQDIRPLKVLILNLMPVKITTEVDFIRLLSNNPLQVEIDFLMLSSHTSKNTPQDHIKEFYTDFESVKKDYYDGMIITGAPVENFDFEEVRYWNEVKSIFDWARNHVTSTLYICWAAQAALYHFYGVNKYPLPQKRFGIFKHEILDPKNTLFRGFDSEFNIPHSRHTEISKEDISKVKDITILAESKISGVGVMSTRGGREFYLTGHSEYSPLTLHGEYVRDKEKGMDIALPENYYRDNNPDNKPLVTWSAHANLLFNNWLNYYVYQETPFDSKEIASMKDIKQEK